MKGLKRKHDYVIESSVLTLRQPLIQTCQQGKLRSILKYTAQLNFASVAGRDVTIQDITGCIKVKWSKLNASEG